MFLVYSLIACVGADSVPTPTPAPEAPPAAKAESAFFVWYNPGKMLYRSTDGTSWTGVAPLPDDLNNWYIGLAADAGGRMYAGARLNALFTSADGGKTWSAVTPAGTLPAGAESESVYVCGGAANVLAAVSSAGRTYSSSDAGQSWTEKGRLAAEGAAGAGDGFMGGCSFSADGTKLLAEGWYFDPAGPHVATSSDGGTTWTDLPRPDVNVSTTGVGFVAGSVVFAFGGSYNGGTVAHFPDGGTAWTKSLPLRGSPAPKWATQRAASDGQNTVVVWENPGEGADGAPAVPGSAFVSKDGGKTFTTSVGPVAADPTPDVWDEYIAMGWTNGKTPGAMPPVTVAAAVAAEPPPPVPAKAADAAAPAQDKPPAKAEGKARPGNPNKQGKSIERHK